MMNAETFVIFMPLVYVVVFPTNHFNISVMSFWWKFKFGSIGRVNILPMSGFHFQPASQFWSFAYICNI